MYKDSEEPVNAVKSNIVIGSKTYLVSMVDEGEGCFVEIVRS